MMAKPDGTVPMTVIESLTSESEITPSSAIVSFVASYVPLVSEPSATQFVQLRSFAGPPFVAEPA